MLHAIKFFKLLKTINWKRTLLTYWQKKEIFSILEAWSSLKSNKFLYCDGLISPNYLVAFYTFFSRIIKQEHCWYFMLKINLNCPIWNSSTYLEVKYGLWDVFKCNLCSHYFSPDINKNQTKFIMQIILIKMVFISKSQIF